MKRPPRGASHAPLPWTDYQTVLTVARLGSVARATEQLGMSHATLLRHLDRIESRLQVRLFERVRGHYQLTAAGHEIEAAGRAIEALAQAAETRARGHDLRPSGEVRLSTSSIVATHLLPRVLAQFGTAFPEVRIELSTSRELVNLRRRDADVALRIVDEVPDWLVGRRLGTIEFKAYARRMGGVRQAARPLEVLRRERRWIAFERDAPDQKFDRWLSSMVDDAQVVLRVDNFTHAAALAEAGLGVALLPSFVEASLPTLEPLTGPIEALATPLWLITHPELAGAARVQVVMRAFGAALANRLEPGRRSAPVRT